MLRTFIFIVASVLGLLLAAALWEITPWANHIPKTTAMVLAALLLLGIGGLFVDVTWVRVTIWILSLPPLFYGLVIIVPWVLAESSSGLEKWIACTLAFWPTIRCAVGETIRYWSWVVSHA